MSTTRKMPQQENTRSLSPQACGEAFCKTITNLARTMGGDEGQTGDNKGRIFPALIHSVSSDSAIFQRISPQIKHHFLFWKQVVTTRHLG